jgi:hypothetical protein
MPCATKKTVWDLRLEKSQTNHGQAKINHLYSVSHKAFTLLLLENRFERWLDVFTNHKGPVMQERGVKQREFQSDIPTVYTRGGIKYNKTSVMQWVKGWSAEGIVRFNMLFDLVKRDWAEKPDFERRWLAAGQKAQAEEGPKKHKLPQPQARSELFESENEDNVAPTATEELVDELGSDTDNDTD